MGDNWNKNLQCCVTQDLKKYLSFISLPIGEVIRFDYVLDEIYSLSCLLFDHFLLYSLRSLITIHAQVLSSTRTTTSTTARYKSR